ncbi:hypothetical protein D2Q93_06365 [Alicyclobacillaceae bacterium I2511]|nr:hypothetical protein D2Q93_06365 [Alicyclobacillaceae bacterium I2511]
MRFFGRNHQMPTREDLREQQQRAEKTIAALERGQIPPYVRNRIESQKAQGQPWTSDLSVNEWLLLQQYGLKPVGMVMGSSVYHIGYSATNYRGTWASRRMPDLEAALLEGRKLALNRLQEEAQLLGAHAVVGISLDTRLPDLHSHQTEFVAFGTAVLLDGLPVPKEPLLCTVSAVDFVKLMQSGTVPISVGLGVSAYYQCSTRQDAWQEGSWYNQEMVHFSESTYEVRHLAMRNLERQIRDVGGTGVLAHETFMKVYEMEADHGAGEQTDHILEFVAIGTIVSVAKNSPQPTIRMGILMNDSTPNSTEPEELA